MACAASAVLQLCSTRNDAFGGDALRPRAPMDVGAVGDAIANDAADCIDVVPPNRAPAPASFRRCIDWAAEATATSFGVTVLNVRFVTLRNMYGLAVTAAFLLYILWSDCGVAAEGLLSVDIRLPSCRMADTSSAQNHDVPSFLRGISSAIAMP